MGAEGAVRFDEEFHLHRVLRSSVGKVVKVGVQAIGSWRWKRSPMCCGGMCNPKVSSPLCLDETHTLAMCPKECDLPFLPHFVVC